MYIYVYLYIYQDPQKSKNVDWPNNALNVHTAASLFSNQFADLKCVYCLELPIRPNPCIFGQIWISRIRLFLNVESRFCGGSGMDPDNSKPDSQLWCVAALFLSLQNCRPGFVSIKK